VTAVSEAAPTPPGVRWAAVGVVVEGVAALAVGVVLAVVGLLSFSVWGFLVLLGVAVAGAGVALLRGVRGARGPAVVVQLLMLGVAYYAAVPSERPAFGFPVAVVAVAVLVGLLSRAGREWAAS
jgi:hypothetical protein